jgi:hypothetical protein
MSKKKVKENADNLLISIAIRDIKTISFFEVDPAEYAEELSKGVPLLVSMQAKFDISENKEIFSINFNVKFSHEKMMDLFGIITKTIFEIKNSDNVIEKIGNTKYRIKDDIIRTLFSIAIGNTRGMLVSVVKNDAYKNQYLPILDLNILIDSFKAANKNFIVEK